MVRMGERLWLYVICLCWLPMKILAAEPIVDAAIDSPNNQANFPIPGTITITHDQEEEIDSKSFVMEGKSLDVSFVKKVKMSDSKTSISIYRFELPAQQKGLYVLPAISIKINGKIYSTTPSTYEVQDEATAPQPAAASTQPATPLIFRLEASVEGPSTLYPGERAKFIYRISYNRSIDLTRSELPLIHPAHFQKVGDVQIRDSQLSDVTVQDLTQEVEASELGTFSFGPSLIEGYAYTMQGGKKVYDSQLLKAEAPLIAVEVKPLPQSIQPISFTGGLGRIQIENRLTSPHSLLAGDTLQLEVKIQGISNFEDLHFPRLQCQPGFSGFFQISDLPPLAEVKDNAKFFYVELRPLNAFIQKIPSIEISSFDSAKGQYVTQHTDSIPITVTAPHVEERSPIASIPLLAQFPSISKWPVPVLSPLEIEGNPVEQDLMTNSWLKSDRVLWLLPIGLILLLLQLYWKREWEKRPKPQVPKSEELLRQALKKENVQLLEQAFWHRLWEKGKVSRRFMQLDAVTPEKELASIRSFIFQLQAWQYSRNKNVNFTQVKRDAKRLFDQI